MLIRKAHLFFTGAETMKGGVPFLLDAEMHPLTAANAWLRHLAQGGETPSFHTRRTYAYHLFDFFSYLIEHGIDWCQITNDNLLNYRDVQDQNRSPHTKRLLNRKTINARLLTIGKFYSYALQKGFLDRNPLTYKTIKYRRPADDDMLAHLGGEQSYETPYATFERLPKNAIKWKSQSEVTQWLNSSDVWRDKLIAKLMYRTGMRRGEVVNLRTWQLPKRQRVDESLLEMSFEIEGKGRKKRLIHLAMRDFVELRDYIKIERSRLIRLAKTKHDFIFVSRDGKPLTANSLNPIFKRISEKSGIYVTPHMLRHSFAVLALSHWRSLGMSQPEKLLQGRLGHSSITTTQVYMHMTDELKAEEAYANSSLIELLIKGESIETKQVLQASK